MQSSISEKKYFKIGEVSNLAGLQPHVLRFWESEFNCILPRKDSGNQRLYTRKDVDSILEIKKLLYEEKYTIPGAKKKLRERKPDRTIKAADQRTENMRSHLIRCKKELEEIRAMLSE